MRILNPGTWKRRNNLGQRENLAGHLAGFTLLEVLVTLFIITLLVGLVVPRLGQSDLDTVRRSGLRFRNVLQWLQDQATYTGGEYRLKLDFAEQSYWCELRNGTTFSPVTDPLLQVQRLNLSQGRMVWVPYDNGIADADEVVVAFSPFGPDRPIMVRFVGLDGLGYSVSLRPEWWAPRLAEGLLAWDAEEVNH